MDISLEYIAISLFLAILILLTKIEDIIKREDSKSYKYIAGGISLMALMSLMDIFYMQGFFKTIPFMATEIFFRVIMWIGNIMGIVFLLSGLSNWLPISRTYRQIAKENMVRFDIVTKIDQLLNVESRIHQVIKSTVNYIVKDFELHSGAVYLFAQSNESAKLINTSGTTKSLEKLLKQLELDKNFISHKNSKIKLRRYFTEQLNLEAEIPSIIHQLKYKDKTFGVVLLWGDKTTEINLEIEKVVRVIFDLITNRIHQKISIMNNEFHNLNQQVSLETVEMLRHNDSVKDVMVTLFQSIQNIMNVSFMSVVEIQSNKTINRYSIGSSHTILQEHNVKTSFDSGVLGYINNMKNIYYDNNVDSMAYDTHEEIYTSDTAQSILALPIKQNDKILGMLVLSANSISGFKIKDIKILTTITNLLAVLLFETKKPTLETNLSKTALTTFDFDELFKRSKDEAKILGQAAKYLFNTLNLSVIRIFLFDDDQLFGSSKTLIHENDVDVITPGQGSLILSMLPLHNQAVLSENIMEFGTGQINNMSEMEASQVLSRNIKSGLIIPLRTGLKTVGLISIGNVNNRHYSEADKEVGQIIAGKISEILLGNLLENRINKHVKKIHIKNTSKTKEEFKMPERFTGTVDYKEEKVFS